MAKADPTFWSRNHFITRPAVNSAPLVRADMLRLAMQSHQPGQRQDHVLRNQRTRYLNCQTFIQVLYADQSGYSFFSRELLQPVNYQHLFRDHALEPGVLGFQFPKLAGIRHFHPTILVTPAVKRLFNNIALSAHILNLGSRYFGFPQDTNDLFFGESLLHL